MSKTNIVIISNIEWNFLKQRHQHIALGLADDYNIIYIESSAKRNPKFSDIPRIFVRLFRHSNRKQIINNINIITPIVLPSTFKIFRILNNWIFSKRLATKIMLKMNQSSPTIIWNYLPSQTSLDLIQSISHDVLIYDCVSNFEAFKDMPKDTVQIEKQIVSLSDLVLTDCDFLYNKHKSLAKKIKLVEPGVNFSLFNQFARKPNKNIRTIIYFGLIDNKIDFELLDYLKKERFDITLIGPNRVNGERLLGFNVYPPVSNEQLPNILGKYDAIIIPYIRNDFMKGVIPAKAFECFATGKTVIVTGLDSMAKYKEFIIYEENNKKLVRLLRNHCDNNKKQKGRINIAREHDWDKIIDKIKKMLKDGLNEKRQ